MSIVRVNNNGVTLPVAALVVVSMKRNIVCCYLQLMTTIFLTSSSISSFQTSVASCRYDFQSTPALQRYFMLLSWIPKPTQHYPLALRMGLYDKPLPPLPNDFNDDKNCNDGVDSSSSSDNDDDDDEYVSERLFEFDLNGKEVRSLLPPLKRRLTSGVQCYYEPTDRIVQNLVTKTSVNYVDACWALEACGGDIQEAWTRISVARRMRLNQKRTVQIMNEQSQQQQESLPTDLDWEEYEIDVEDEYNTRKAAMEVQDRERKRDLYNQPSKPDDPWLPRSKPPPISDEPWFTG